MNADEISADVNADRLPRGAAALVLSAAAACSSGSGSSGGGGSASSTPSSAPLKDGRSVTVLESSGYSGAWTTLDPAENKEGAATQDFMTVPAARRAVRQARRAAPFARRPVSNVKTLTVEVRD